MRLALKRVKSKIFFFCALEYCFQHSQYLSHSEEQSQRKRIHGKKAIGNHLFKKGSSAWGFALRRTTDGTDLDTALVESEIISFNIEICEDKIHLFAYGVAVCVLHEFICVSIFYVASSSSHSLMERSNAILASLHGIVVNTVTHLRADGSGKVCGHRQNLYNETF